MKQIKGNEIEAMEKINRYQYPGLIAKILDDEVCLRFSGSRALAWDTCKDIEKSFIMTGWNVCKGDLNVHLYKQNFSSDFLDFLNDY